MLTALITGQFRTPDLLARTLSELRTLRQRGVLLACIVATWASDAAQFRAALAEAGVEAEVLACRPPRLELPNVSSLLYQQTTLREGLARCPDGFVLRLRADTFIAADLIEAALQALTRLRATRAVPLFSERIWTPWIDYDEPFHVADELLLGQRGDLQRLARFNIDPLIEFGYPIANTHTLVFLPDRTSYGRIYFDFLAAERDSGVLMNDATTAKFAKLDLAMNVASYQAMLGLWYRTALDNFVCFSEPEQISFHPGGGRLASYYSDRRPLSTNPDRLFEPAGAGFFNHFYIWDLDAFQRMLAGLDPTFYGPLLDSMADPHPLLADTGEHHAASFAAMMAEIKAKVPPGKEPDPGPRTRLRRTVRRLLQRALRAVG